jgi:hypothetical protein
MNVPSLFYQIVGKGYLLIGDSFCFVESLLPAGPVAELGEGAEDELSMFSFCLVSASAYPFA